MKTSLRPTVAHLEIPFCMSEPYIVIFALGDNTWAKVEMGVKGQEPLPLRECRPEPSASTRLAVFDRSRHSFPLKHRRVRISLPGASGPSLLERKMTQL